ncbi:Putative ribonuclease H protein At1g65750 [Linum grandiflorum]
MCAVSSILGQLSDDCRHSPCIRAIQSLLHRDWDVSITHISREGNLIADLFANHGHSLPFGMHIISSFQTDIVDCIRDDMAGISFPRQVHVRVLSYFL